MVRTSQNCRSHCPINFLLETVGDKWSLLVVRDLMFKGKRRFGEFLDSDEGIATNILTQRLKHLEDHGIVTKSVDPENRTKRLYSLTDKGKGLLPLMLEITAWSAEHDALTNAPSEFVARLVNDRQAVIDEISAALQQDE